MTREEGILVGESSGTAVAAALLLAEDLVAQGRGPESTIGVVLPDTGRNYLSKPYSDDWLRDRGVLGSATGLEGTRFIG